MKVYMGRHFVDGILRVVEALRAGLPAHGITVVDDPAEADLLAMHGADRIPRDDLPLVAHVHGLLWDDYRWPPHAQEVNARIIHAMARADAITAPSRWVANAISRGMLRRPVPIHHGVDADAWAYQGAHEGYVLWNKARADAVSDPRPVNRVAELAPGVPFVTTIGRPTPNVQVIGPRPYGEMKGIVQRAGVYLATTQETFGVGTLEALAAGVPVVGYRWGGQEEIIVEGETGYLVPPGDDRALAEAIRQALQERPRLSQNAADDARTRWGWAPRVAEYAKLYLQVVKRQLSVRPKVSVVVTCYNLGKYLNAALDSVVWNNDDATLWELIVVDDHSTDDSYATALALKDYYNGRGQFAITVVQTPENLGLSGARNYGAAHASGDYLLFLDADDELAPGALARLVEALDRDPGLHIAYGALQLMDEQGNDRGIGPWPGDFDWRQQMAHLNQLHYSSLMRRQVWEEVGGYRVRDWRAEDAAFWCRATSFGFRAAKVTDQPTLRYRVRQDSKSQQENRTYVDRDGDWTKDFPWATAHSGPEGLERRNAQRIEPPLGLVPFGAQGEPPRRRKAWSVWHHNRPAVSVIIPCGPGHKDYLIDALDSLVAQDCQAWEAIIVNDSGEWLDEVPGAPYARIVNLLPPYEGKGHGPSVARNQGLAEARAPLVLFLDADDWLRPDALRLMLARYAQGDASYVYSDWVAYYGRDEEEAQAAPEASPEQIFGGLYHPVTVLMATEDARRVEFDPSIKGWEDWDFFIRCAIGGLCGARVAAPLLSYRLHSGTMRQKSQSESEAIRTIFRQRYGAWATGEREMAGCCGGNADALIAAKEAIAPMTQLDGDLEAPAPTQAGMVIVEYVGSQDAPVTFFVNNRPYKGARAALHRFREAPPEDAERLVQTGQWAIRTPPKTAQVHADAELETLPEGDVVKPKSRSRK